MAAKSKARTLIVRMVSTAQTGYFYTCKRLRLGPRLAAVKYDPRGVCRTSHLSTFFSPSDRFTVKSRVLFVENKKTAKK
ncbi:39S ribosomal protein L33, mitochondrial [Grifola frondosa]|uniref:Large ribosomal subunit protein bL33m n=1 Tax=Grifola frondosa TaxID=5627 RepID=A0A1C7M1T7_GRIFR|nr:39S ribosomal protein L33, mitochondrial [Grifola frondosa]